MRDLFYPIVHILGIVVLVILASSILLGEVQEPFTFTGLLDYISNTGLTFDFTGFQDHTIQGDWAIFDGLRWFLNLFIRIFDFGLFIVDLLFQLINFVFGLFRFFFFR